MCNNFYQDAIDDVRRIYQSAKEYIDYIIIAHGALNCWDNPSLTEVFYESLRIFFIHLRLEIKIIFTNIYHRKKYSFLIIGQ